MQLFTSIPPLRVQYNECRADNFDDGRHTIYLACVCVSVGPMGLTAFEAKTLSPSIFREMLRRSFNMKVSDGKSRYVRI